MPSELNLRFQPSIARAAALLLALSAGAGAAQASSATAPSAPTGAAPASAPAGASVALDPTRLRGAPTLEALARLKMAEKEQQAKERFEKLFPPPPAPAPVAAKATDAPRAVVAPPPPPPNRRVVAIHGRIGAERADIERADGVVVTVQAGSVVEGYRIVKVSSAGVQIVTPSQSAPVTVRAGSMFR